jgi:hypothetical protein
MVRAFKFLFFYGQICEEQYLMTSCINHWNQIVKN